MLAANASAPDSAMPGSLLDQGPVQVRQWEGKQNLQTQNPRETKCYHPVFFLEAITYPCLQPREMRVISIWTKPLLVESHASGTVSFHTPTSLSSMGPLDGAASENGNARVSQAAERQMKPRIGRHSACEMWVSTATTVKGWLENFHRYLSSADNEIL